MKIKIWGEALRNAITNMPIEFDGSFVWNFYSLNSKFPVN